jgi:hypothetical protein
MPHLQKNSKFGSIRRRDRLLECGLTRLLMERLCDISRLLN